MFTTSMTIVKKIKADVTNSKGHTICASSCSWLRRRGKEAAVRVVASALSTAFEDHAQLGSPKHCCRGEPRGRRG